MGISTLHGDDVLIGNHAVLGKHPGRDIGGGATGLGMNRGNANKSSMNRQRFTHETWDSLSGVPDGYGPEYAWVIPITAGGMSARGNLVGEGDIADLNLAGGLNAEAALSGAGDLSGLGALVVSLVAALSGSGDITNADADAFLNLAASLAGSGDLTGALTALGHAAAALSGSGDASATATALGTLAASITVTGDLVTTANIGAAVWDYILSCGYTAEEAMQILTAVAAGKTTVTDLGGGLANVIFRDLQDVQDVVDADMTGSERTTVTLNP